MTELDPFARIAAEFSPELSRRRRALYVALGDSFTAGTGCGAGESWPEQLAAEIRADHPTLELRNLAVEGATSAEVLEQLPEAVELEPDLVTLVCGANDVLDSTRPDVDAYAARLELMLDRLREAVPGVRIATATAPDRWDFLPLRSRTRARVERAIAEINAATLRVAAERDVACLDVAGHPGLSEPDNFNDDGLHPSRLGHRRAAVGFAALLRERYGLEIANEGGEA